MGRGFHFRGVKFDPQNIPFASSALIMSAGIASVDQTIGADAHMGVISTHGADIGFCSRIRISFTPPARRTMALRSVAQSTQTTPVAALQARETASAWPARSARSPLATLPTP